VLLLNEC